MRRSPGPGESALDAPRPFTPVWSISDDGREFEVRVGNVLSARFDLRSCHVRASVHPGLPDSDAALVARLLLEAPVATLLSQRGHQILHAGALLLPRGAVVLRGPSGAGKSTLVAAAWKAGLPILGDESLLVSRQDPDLLSASVRELTVLPSTAELLGLSEVGVPDASGREPKLRIELFPGTGAAGRTARRAATVLLGPRDPGPARLTRLSREAFLTEFAKGEIPQERMGGAEPGGIASAWASSGGWLLTGASDLRGALALLRGAAG